jgi:hypothetical protein
MIYRVPGWCKCNQQGPYIGSHPLNGLEVGELRKILCWPRNGGAGV